MEDGGEVSLALGSDVGANVGPAVGVAVGIVVGGALLFCHRFVFVVSFPCCLFIFFFASLLAGEGLLGLSDCC